MRAVCSSVATSATTEVLEASATRRSSARSSVRLARGLEMSYVAASNESFNACQSSVMYW
jgi:hypothetical protein